MQNRYSPEAFWLLALSARGVRLYHGGAARLTRIELPQQISRSIADSGEFDVPDHDLESRSSPGASNRQMAAIRFGTSNDFPKGRRYLRDHFARVSHAVYPIVARTGLPMILAGVSRELGVYREVDRYPNTLDGAIVGSPDALTERQLCEKACEILTAPRSGAKFVAQIAALNDNGYLLENMDQIRAAAQDGRVNRLFIDTAAYQSSGESIDADLINNAALAVLAHSGTIECAADLRLSNNLAAELRYVAPQFAGKPGGDPARYAFH